MELEEADLTMSFGREGLVLDVCRSRDVPRTIPSYAGLRSSAARRCSRLREAQPPSLNSYNISTGGESLFSIAVSH